MTQLNKNKVRGLKCIMVEFRGCILHFFQKKRVNFLLLIKISKFKFHLYKLKIN